MSPTAIAAPQSHVSFCGEAIRSYAEDPRTTLTVDLAVNEIIGDAVTAYAKLTDGGGAPVIAAPVNFYVGSGSRPSDWIGHAITDCDGVAILRFTRDEPGPLEITAKFDGGNALTRNEITAALELKRIAKEEPVNISLESFGAVAMVGMVVSGAVVGVVLATREDEREVIGR